MRALLFLLPFAVALRRSAAFEFRNVYQEQQQSLRAIQYSRALSDKGNLITNIEPGDQGILGGNTIDATSWIAILGDNQCMGVLVHRDIVMTTATCIRLSDTPAKVSIAPSNLTAVFQFNGSAVDQEATQMHPCYDSNLLLNDIALIKLSVPMPEDYAPVILNKNPDATRSNGQGLAVLGYGTSDISTPNTGNPNLQEAFTTYIDTCYTQYPQYSNLEQLCTVGQPDVGICNGDMGAPLFSITIADATAEYISMVGMAAGIYVRNEEQICANGNTDIFV